MNYYQEHLNDFTPFCKNIIKHICRYILGPISVQDLMDGISDEWKEILLDKEYIEDVENVFNLECDIQPSKCNWFQWAKLTQLYEIRLIIIGQDPYHTSGIADGLAFSSSVPSYCPPSLKNVFKCLSSQNLLNQNDAQVNLESWARQGVLLLNTAFTVEKGIPKSHSSLWKEYFHHVLFSIVNLYKDRPITNRLPILMWGNDAKSAVHNVITEKSRDKFLLLYHCHPSPFNGDRFLSCTHFQQVNQQFISAGEAPIQWNSISKPKTDKVQIVYTDGSSFNGESGYACVFTSGPMDGRIRLGKLDDLKGTNIRAEGIAIARAIQLASQLEVEEIQIITDSEFWIKMIEQYMPTWSEEKFKKQKNPELTRALHDLCIDVRRRYRLVFKWVPSHGKGGVKYEFNEMADREANKARLTLKHGQEIWTKFNHSH